MHSYEHDGLCFSLQGADLEELVQACSTACGFLVTIERAKGVETCLQELQQRSDIDTWAPGTDDWERAEQLIARARVEPLSSHRLFAEVLLNEEKVADDIPWPITHLFRLCPHAKERAAPRRVYGMRPKEATARLCCDTTSPRCFSDR